MKKLACIFLAILPIACTAQEAPSEDAPAGTESAAASDASEKSVHNAICGHKLEAIGKCGNYVEIDGEWHEIADAESHGLGVMEWCSSADDQIEVAGSVEDGKFVATYLKVIG